MTGRCSRQQAGGCDSAQGAQGARRTRECHYRKSQPQQCGVGSLYLGQITVMSRQGESLLSEFDWSVNKVRRAEQFPRPGDDLDAARLPWSTVRPQRRRGRSGADSLEQFEGAALPSASSIQPGSGPSIARRRHRQTGRGTGYQTQRFF